MLAVGPLGILVLHCRDLDHLAVITLATQPAKKGAFEQLGVEPVSLGAPMLARHRYTRCVNDIGLDTARLDQRANQKPSRPASKATAIRSILRPAFSASSRHRCSSFSNALSSTTSFFNGWRSTPGTIPATSQLDRLISMTAISVPSGSRAARDRFRSFNFCIGALHRFTSATMECNILAADPKHLPSWDSMKRRSNLSGGLAVRQSQADMRTHLIARPARDIVALLGGSRLTSYRIDLLPVMLPRFPWSSGTRCRQPRCGAGSRPTGVPRPRSPSSFR